jgi:hypothetical protein
MITPRLSLALLLPLALAACMVPTGPVEVSRFHLEDTSALGHGSIAVVAAPGADAASNEQQSFQIAVEQQLGAGLCHQTRRCRRPDRAGALQPRRARRADRPRGAGGFGRFLWLGRGDGHFHSAVPPRAPAPIWR